MIETLISSRQGLYRISDIDNIQNVWGGKTHNEQKIALHWRIVSIFKFKYKFVLVFLVTF